MKKAIYILSILLLFFQSCSSSDDSESSSSNYILVKKIIETTPDGTFTTIFTYDGNKLATANFNNGGGTAKYYYLGELIEKVEIYDNNNNMVEKTIYNYNSNNQLASYIILNYSNNEGEKGILTYNSNGTISCTEYEGSLTSQTNQTITKTITLTNGEMSSLQINNGSVTGTYTYTYDNKNSPFKNVLGVNKVTFAVFRSFHSEIKNNLIQKNQNSGGYSLQYNYEYTYDSNNYPLTRIETLGIHSDNSQQFFY